MDLVNQGKGNVLELWGSNNEIVLRRVRSYLGDAFWDGRDGFKSKIRELRLDFLFDSEDNIVQVLDEVLNVKYESFVYYNILCFILTKIDGEFTHSMLIKDCEFCRGIELLNSTFLMMMGFLEERGIINCTIKDGEIYYSVVGNRKFDEVDLKLLFFGFLLDNVRRDKEVI